MLFVLVCALILAGAVALLVRLSVASANDPHFQESVRRNEYIKQRAAEENLGLDPWNRHNSWMLRIYSKEYYEAREAAQKAQQSGGVNS